MGCNCGGSTLRAPVEPRLVQQKVKTDPNDPRNFAPVRVFRSPNGPAPKEG